VVFRGRLREYIDQYPGEISGPIYWVVHQYDKLKEDFRYWENDIDTINLLNGQSLEFLEHVHRLWDCTSMYFQALAEQEEDRINFFNLVSSHIRHVVNFWHETHDRM